MRCVSQLPHLVLVPHQVSRSDRLSRLFHETHVPYKRHDKSEHKQDRTDRVGNRTFHPFLITLAAHYCIHITLPYNSQTQQRIFAQLRTTNMRPAKTMGSHHIRQNPSISAAAHPSRDLRPHNVLADWLYQKITTVEPESHITATPTDLRIALTSPQPILPIAITTALQHDSFLTQTPKDPQTVHRPMARMLPLRHRVKDLPKSPNHRLPHSPTKPCP
jgi:hypothetical protein